MSFALLTVLGLALGRLAATDAALAATAVVLVVFFVLVATRPALVAVTAFGLVFLGGRIGPGGAISYTDALVAGAAALALPALSGSVQARRMTAVQRGVWVYFVSLIPTLLVNWDVKSGLEWIHRLVLVGGALAVGAWLAREQLTVVAFRFFVIVATFFAVASIVTSARTGFQPAYPFGYHKNFVGSITGAAVVILLATPQSVRLRLLFRVPIVCLVIAGTLATQSRGSLLGAALGILIMAFRNRAGASIPRRVVGLAIALGLAIFSYISINSQLQDKAEFNNNSLGTRVRVEARTREIWHTSPIVGVGLRYYNIRDYGREATASNNAYNNELAESGIVGAAGFTVFHLALFTALARRRGPLATAALGVTAGQFLHGQVDIYWSAGVTSLPMMLAGIALASTRTLGERGQGVAETPEEVSVSKSDSALAKI